MLQSQPGLVFTSPFDGLEGFFNLVLGQTPVELFAAHFMATFKTPQSVFCAPQASLNDA